MSEELDRRGRPRRRRQQEDLTWDEVKRRNFVEGLKEEKHPLKVRDDIPALIDMHYDDIPEEDILRLQWWGLYHDKPKVGYFMMRVKIPGGKVTPEQLRTIGRLSVDYGKSYAEISTRQCIQLHWIKLEYMPDIFKRLEAVGLTTQGACGDILRNVTSCPVSGISPDELFDPTPTIDESVKFFLDFGYGNLPRKHKHTFACCPYHCNMPEIHDIGMIGTIQDGREGFAIVVGGGLSTVPRIAKPLGVFAPKEEVIDVLRGLVEVWSADLNYRKSRVKARFKFMVDDLGPEEIRQRVETHLGRKLIDLAEVPKPIGRTDHMGIHEQRQKGLFYVGFPVFPGRVTGEQLMAVSDIIADFGGDVRFTREQNFIVTGVPEALLPGFLSSMSDLGFTLEQNAVRGHSIGCTGEPYCNYAVGETKDKVVELVEHLEATFGEAISDLRIHLDGCPHACGEHWIGDIGVQGTTKTLDDGTKARAYDIILRGGFGRDAAIGRAIGRRVLAEDLKLQVERLVRFYLTNRSEGEGMQAFTTRQETDVLQAVLEGTELAEQSA